MRPPIDSYIGKRYVDCWAFVQAVYLEQLGVALPRALYDSGCLLKVGVEPAELDICMIAGLSHCGVRYKNGILHQAPTFGVIYDIRRAVTSNRFYQLLDSVD